MSKSISAEGGHFGYADPELVEELNAKADELDMQMDRIEELNVAYEGLKQIKAELESLEEGEELSTCAKAMLNHGLESYLGRVGLESCDVIGEEEDMDLEVALEGITDVMAKIKTKIQNYTNKATKAFGDFMAKAGDFGARIEADAEELLEDIKTRGGKPKNETIKFSSAHAMHINGKTDIKSLQTAISNSRKMLDAVTTKFVDEVNKRHRNLIRNYMGAAAEGYLKYLFSYTKVVEGYKEVDKNFVRDSKEALTAALGKVPSGVPMAGGLRLVTKRKFTLINMIPSFGQDLTFLEKTGEKVDSSQEIPTPSLDEIEKILKEVQEIGSIIDKRHKGLFERFEELNTVTDKAYHERMSEDGSRIGMWLANGDGAMEVSKTAHWFSRPIKETYNAAHSAARAYLAMSRKAIKQYDYK